MDRRLRLAARSGFRQVRLVRRGFRAVRTASGGAATESQPAAVSVRKSRLLWNRRATDGEADSAAARMPSVLHLRQTAVGKGGRAAGAIGFMRVWRAAE